MITSFCIKHDINSDYVLFDEKVVLVGIEHNMCLEVVIDGDIPELTNVKRDNDPGYAGEYRWGIDNDGVVAFGFMCDDVNKRPGHGGYWSSNSADVRKELGIDCMEVTVITKQGWHMAASMLVSKVKELLPDYYEIRETDGGFRTIVRKDIKDYIKRLPNGRYVIA